MATDTIADYPAYRIYRAYEGRKFKHGDKIAIPFNSRSHGILYHFFTLGTVAGYAIERGEDPVEAIERCEQNKRDFPHNGHKLYWANANAVVLSNMRPAKEEVPGFEFGDTITLQGRRFMLAKAPNDNCSLIPVEA